MGRGIEDEDELGGYYNFEGANAKPDLAPAYRAPAQPQKQPEIQQPIQRTGDKPAPSKKQDTVAPPETLQSTAHSEPKQLSIDDLAYMKEQFVEREERERLDPSNIQVRVLFVYGFTNQTDPDLANHAEATTDRKLYSFFTNKQSRIQDLKQNLIQQEFGFEVS